MDQRLRSMCLVTIVALVLPSLARADIALPKPKTKDLGSRPVVIRVEKDAKEIRLQIPAKLLAAAPPQASITPVRTIFAGLAMSVAVVSLFFVRKGSRRVRGSVVAMVAFAAVFTVVGMLCADIRPPDGGSRRPRPRPGQKPQADLVLPAGTMIHNDAVIEVTQDGDELTLILPTRLQDKIDQAAAEPVRPAAPAPPAPTQ